MAILHSIALHAVLSFSPQSRQKGRTSPPLIWDLRLPPSTARAASHTHHIVPPYYLSQPATSPPTPYIRIVSGVFPFDWRIDVQNPYGVTVGDVLDGISRGLRRGVTQREWAQTSRTQKARVADAFYARTLQSADPRREHSQGVRRVDWLLKHTTFVGLTPSPEMPYTWTLTTKRADR
ncbi:hypothetical protein BD410DRAFT_725144 [Rickenella mellea]|uniref:DUF6699 domain-containing protein n=1 Tax=Rickenella mellea TaxID=50990 RepID=A0A4Y7Q201_9AGAM|nr:hypothetical protein BD410DRAFT_725144 [Rickenella mellea]